MRNGKLNWTGIKPDGFELLILNLAQYFMPNQNWDRYLKSGHKQDGIDIKAFNKNTCKDDCIQCKFKEELTSGDLSKILNEFKTGKFFGHTSKFIIATSADLQKPQLIDFLDQEAERLQTDYAIELEWWDITNIEEKLKNCYRLVCSYFTKSIAEEHCYPGDFHNLGQYTSIADYISRSIIKVDNENPLYVYNWFGNRNSKQLIDLFKSDPMETKRICLIADAYQGKSTLLEQFAFELSNEKLGFAPVFIKIKQHNLRPLENILNEQHPSWIKYNRKDLVIIVDGLDEVPNDRFIDYIKAIKEFSTAYSSLNVIVSCRKLFFTHYRLSESEWKFEYYELCLLTQDQIEQYALRILGNKKTSFQKYITKYRLEGLLDHPFYLTSLLKQYKSIGRSQDLPKTKAEIINHIIDESLTPIRNRQLTSGNLLLHEKKTYNLSLKKIALVCQLIGENSIDFDFVRQLFDDKEIELLTNSSVLTTSSDKWTFNITFFQENLAALALLQLQFEEIESIVTVGNKYKKIKTKWIQTLASCLSLIVDDDSRFTKLINLIEQDNIELIAFCDPSKFVQQFRVETIKKIIAKCIKRDSFPQVRQIEVIASFIKDSNEALEYIISNISQNQTSTIKYLCWKLILQFESLLLSASTIQSIALRELESALDGYYAAILVRVLQKFLLITDDTIEHLLKNKLITNVQYLDSLFELLIERKLVDKYYWLGIEALPIYNKHSDNIVQYGFQSQLQKYLLSAESATNVSMLLKHVAAKKWNAISENSSYGEVDREQLLRALTNLAIEAHNKDHSIFMTFSKIAFCKVERFHTGEYKIVLEFYKKTDTESLFFQYCLVNIEHRHNWCLPLSISETCLQYIFGQYEIDDTFISFGNIVDWYYGVKAHSGNDKLANGFYNLIVSVTGDDLSNKDREDEYKRHLIYEEQKSVNDVEYIISKEAFENGLKKFFEAYGSDVIPDNKLFVGVLKNEKRRMADSTFIAHFLLHYRQNEVETSLDYCLKILTEERFEYFRAKEILNYKGSNKTSETFLEILKKYYDTEILKANFSNAITKTPGGYRIKYKENLLKEIFEQHYFETKEEMVVNMVWLIRDGFNHLKKTNWQTQPKKTFSELLIESVNEELLVKTILSNIEHGIEVDSVLSSHLELCRYLRVSEVNNYILSQKVFGKFSYYEQPNAISIYLELGGDKSQLLQLFLDTPYNETYIKLELCEILCNDFPDRIRPFLLDVMKDVEVSSEYKTKAAIYLAIIGNEIGLIYLLDSSVLTYPYNRALPLKSFSTETTLKLLQPLTAHILDKDLSIRDRDYVSMKEIILDCLYNLAKRSERDLELVERFLTDFLETQNLSEQDVKKVLFYIDDIVEKFREIAPVPIEIEDIKRIIGLLN